MKKRKKKPSYRPKKKPSRGTDWGGREKNANQVYGFGGRVVWNSAKTEGR